jgi:hypothetical protein
MGVNFDGRNALHRGYLEFGILRAGKENDHFAYIPSFLNFRSSEGHQPLS